MNVYKIISSFLIIILLLGIAIATGPDDYEVYITKYEKVLSKEIGSIEEDCVPATLASAVIRVAPEDENGKKISRETIIKSFASNHKVFDDHVRTAITLLNKDKNHDYKIIIYENQMLNGFKICTSPKYYGTKINKQNFDFKGIGNNNVDVEYYYPYNFNPEDIHEAMLKLAGRDEGTGMLVAASYYEARPIWNSNSRKFEIKYLTIASHAFQPIAINKTKTIGVKLLGVTCDGNKTYRKFITNAFKFFDPAGGEEFDTYLSEDWGNKLLKIQLGKERWYNVDTFLFIEKIPKAKSTSTADENPYLPHAYLSYDGLPIIKMPVNRFAIIPLPNCGNGFVEGSEECDHGKNNGKDGLCTTLCEWTFCGDSEVQKPNGKGIKGTPPGFIEACDDGNKNRNDKCTPVCTLTYCRDGIVQKPNGAGKGGPKSDGNEECDDGNNINNDKCTNDCKLTFCGDSEIQRPNGKEGWFEECDNDKKMPVCNNWRYTCDYKCDCILSNGNQ